MIRSFIGIALPDHAASRIADLQRGCPGRAVPRENLHLTLVFLDRQPVAALEDLDAELSGIRAGPLQITLKGLDLFGAGERGVLAVSVEPTAALTAFHGKVQAAVRRSGIRTERRRFRPHVSFARFSAPPDPAAVQRFLDARGGFSPVEFVAAAFTLFRSTLKISGAEYDALAEYPLGDSYPSHLVGY